ncbi:MAG TPA: SpoIID/LytB domain-containing protein [Gaiellaceae bacterium]|nr:SpoIID/LytB domain-containing protein [Gaiellaceae bacterium]
MRLLLATLGAALLLPANALGTVFVLDGGGWGHGVGLSQWGAEGAARAGWTYTRILGHYYPHTRLEIVTPRPVRVLLAEGRKQVAIGSAAPFLLVDARGRRVHVKARTLRFGPRLRLGKRELAPPLRVVAGAQPVTLDGTGYRGELELKVRDGGLMVVNTVALDRYLRGVVPYEMPLGWHLAAYEAQAVVARTYALATLKPGADFDLFADDRSQVYGGIPAERPETSQALGDTANRVLTYHGRVIVAYYSSSSGGRTAAVQTAFPGQQPEPYLVPVADPYDSISPYHEWDVVTDPGQLSRRFHWDVRDLRLDRDGAGRVRRVLLVGPRRTRAVSAAAFRRALGLRSTFFSLRVLSLERPSRSAVYGKPLVLGGFLRNARGVVLQERSPAGGWHAVRRVRTRPDGRFSALLRPRSTTAYRLEVDGEAGDPVEVQVARRIRVRASVGGLAGKVLPAAPVRIERKVGAGWRPVASVPVGPSGFFRTELSRAGSYRATAAAGSRYLASASPPVSVSR